METHFPNGEQVREYSPMDGLVPAVEDAFAAYESGDTVMPPKSYVGLPAYNGDSGRCHRPRRLHRRQSH